MEVTDLVKQVNQDKMSLWNDEKRKDFVNIFRQRAEFSKKALKNTAHNVLQTAKQKHFVGQNDGTDLFKNNHYSDYEYQYDSKLSGEEKSRLASVVTEMSTDILGNLPPLKKAVMVIDPELAGEMTKLEELQEKGNKLAKELVERSAPVKMSELDQKMTIGQFLKEVKDNEKERARLQFELDELGKEGGELSDRINKKLYKGIPGLSEAVVQAVKDCLEKATALDQMTRRVEEKVLFGDSDAALELLQHFEKDEEKLSVNISLQLKAAVDTLGVSKKQLKGKTAAAKK